MDQANMTARAGRLCRLIWRRLMRRPPSMEAVFTDIYRRNAWGDAQSHSGPGSSTVRTADLRPALAALLAELSPATLLDAPCGDFTWMRDVLLGNATYLGVDVVSEIIVENVRRYGGPNREFRQLDITTDLVPRADIILCRDALVHISHADIANALAAFARSGSRYLLTTTFPRVTKNRDVATGGWRPLNLLLPPFAFPAPLREISDFCPVPGYADKVLALWPIALLPHAQKSRD